jgi:hypothetical protein
MAIAMNGSSSKEGNGDSNEGGGQATATATATTTKRVMAMTIRVAGNKDCNGIGGKSDGDSVKGGKLSTLMRAMATRVAAEQQRKG